jgi:hypothetical protein
MIYIECVTVEGQMHRLGPYESAEFRVGIRELHADGKCLVSFGDMFGYSDRIMYPDGDGCQAITNVTVTAD